MSGELPEGWVETTLAEAVELARSTIDPRTQPDTTFNYISLEWVDSGTGSEPEPHLTLGRDIGSAKLPFKPGDVLYGKLRPYLRKVFLATRSGVAVTDLVPLSPRSGIDPSYIKYFLLSPAHDDYVAPLMKGIGMPRLGVSDLENMPLPVAPSSEQQRIVTRLDALQARSRAAREALAEVPALLDLFRQSVLAAAFRGDLTAEWRAKNPDVEPASKLLARIRAERRRRWMEANPRKKYVEPEPVDDSNLPELPEGWCWVTLEELVEPGADIVYGIVQPGPPVDGGIPFVRAQDIQDDEVQIDQLRRTSFAIADQYSRTTLREGDILLGIIRAMKVAVVSRELAGGNTVRGIAVIRPCVEVSSQFLAYQLRSPSVQDRMLDQQRGMDMPVINIKELRRVPVAVAPRAEQDRIAGQVHRQVAAIAQQAASAASVALDLTTLDQSILARAFRGELVDQDPNDEPASALLARIRSATPAAPARARR